MLTQVDMKTSIRLGIYKRCAADFPLLLSTCAVVTIRELLSIAPVSIQTRRLLKLYTRVLSGSYRFVYRPFNIVSSLMFGITKMHGSPFAKLCFLSTLAHGRSFCARLQASVFLNPRQLTPSIHGTHQPFRACRHITTKGFAWKSIFPFRTLPSPKILLLESFQKGVRTL